MTGPRGSRRVAHDVVAVSELKARPRQVLERVAESELPLVVTRNGRPAAVLLSPRAYDELTERARFVTAVDEGLQDADAGRVHAHADVKAEVSRRYVRSR